MWKKSITFQQCVKYVCMHSHCQHNSAWLLSMRSWHVEYAVMTHGVCNPDTWSMQPWHVEYAVMTSWECGHDTLNMRSWHIEYAAMTRWVCGHDMLSMQWWHVEYAVMTCWVCGHDTLSMRSWHVETEDKFWRPLAGLKRTLRWKKHSCVLTSRKAIILPRGRLEGSHD